MDGIISVIKPPGITSHDVIGILRKILKTKKIGHSGTLDPLAMGVLPIYIGKATRLIEYGEGNQKTYIAECKLGISTDTEDITGKVISISEDDKEIDWQELDRCCKKFIGNIDQTPSIYSAIKINGKKAYELARSGQEVNLPSRKVTIYDIKLIAYKYPFFTIQVTCSSGTYIRSLLRDICHQLQKDGTMTALHRIQVGEYMVENSYTLEEVASLGERILRNPEEAVAYLPRFYATEGEAIAICQGKRLSMKGRNLTYGVHTIYVDSTFLGIVDVTELSIKGRKILYFPDAMV